MILFLVVGLIFIVYFDADTLRKQDGQLYERVLSYTPLEWTVLFMAISPVYLLRRYHFQQQLSIVASTAEQNIGAEITEDNRLFQITDATGIVVIWAVFMFWGFIIYEHLAGLYAISLEELEEALIASVFSLLLMIFLIYRTNQRTSTQGFFASVGLVRRGISVFKLIFFPLILGILLAFIAAMIVLNRPEAPITPLSEVLERTKSSTALLFFLAVATLVAPLLEELIFRGYFFAVIRQLKGRVFTVCCIAGIFTLLHVGQYWGDWLAICIVGILGVALTLLREWTGSTISSAVMHYAYNVFVVVFSLLLVFSSNPAYLKYQALFQQLDERTKEELLLESVKENPEFTDGYNDLSWLYVESDRNLDEALDFIERALQKEPENDAYRDTQAEVLYKLGRFEEAVEIETELVRKNPAREVFRQQLKKFQEALEENLKEENK